MRRLWHSTYLVQYVERDRIDHMFHDDAKNRVRSSLSIAGAGYLVLPGYRDLVVRIL